MSKIDTSPAALLALADVDSSNLHSRAETEQHIEDMAEVLRAVAAEKELDEAAIASYAETPSWEREAQADYQAAAETLARVRSGEERTVPLEEVEAMLEKLTRIDEEIEAAAPQPSVPQPPERGFCPELAKRVGFGEGSDEFWALVEQKRKATGGQP
jgi:hypothetical protein